MVVDECEINHHQNASCSLATERQDYINLRNAFVQRGAILEQTNDLLIRITTTFSSSQFLSGTTEQLSTDSSYACPRASPMMTTYLHQNISLDSLCSLQASDNRFQFNSNRFTISSDNSISEPHLESYRHASPTPFPDYPPPSYSSLYPEADSTTFDTVNTACACPFTPTGNFSYINMETGSNLTDTLPVPNTTRRYSGHYSKRDEFTYFTGLKWCIWSPGLPSFIYLHQCFAYVPECLTSLEAAPSSMGIIYMYVHPIHSDRDYNAWRKLSQYQRPGDGEEICFYCADADEYNRRDRKYTACSSHWHGAYPIPISRRIKIRKPIPKVEITETDMAVLSIMMDRTSYPDYQ